MMRNLLDKRIKVIGGNLGVALILILTLCGCESPRADEQIWQGIITERSGLFVKLTSDTLIIYSFTYSRCDTLIIDTSRYSLVGQTYGNVKVNLFQNVIGDLSYSEDSASFSFNMWGKESYFRLVKLENTRIPEDYMIGKRTSSLESYLSEVIRLQEKKLQGLSSLIVLNESAQDYITYFDSLKRRTVVDYLNVQYSKDLCWNRLNGYNELIMEPQYQSKGNRIAIDIWSSRDVFYKYLRNRSSYFVNDSTTTTSLYSKFLDFDNRLDDMKATTGEVIIYYNDMILEIYRIEGLNWVLPRLRS